MVVNASKYVFPAIFLRYFSSIFGQEALTKWLETHLRKDTDMLLPIIEKWKQDGVLLSVDPETVAGVLRSLFLLATQRKQVGAAYPETLSFLIDAVVEQLIVTKGETYE
ncbi:hypothetical protein [Paenibacillus sp. CF384]|uniref:hypothetical protein n=1 Tax=Paenibacillus sp. CF384 TaxID=1884382 RepID=UPI000894E3DD|nr:hypothetical protein [Paenibacillus sp. CF384]SDX71893.1 hypothetical protein SAMN05518855_1019107 [Paenibacillus sp. CF384]